MNVFAISRLATPAPLHDTPLTHGVRHRLYRARAFLLVCAFLSAPALANTEQMTYRVWVGERDLGTHEFTIEHEGDTAKVLSQANFEVKALFVTVFRYRHLAEEVWHNQCLVELRSETEENRDRTRIEAALRDGEFEVIRNGDLLSRTDDCVGSYAYWDRERIQRQSYMNAQTGNIEAGTVHVLGKTALPRVMQPAETLHLVLADAQFRLWYSDSGAWLAMTTERDGREVTYVREDLLD